MTQPVFAWMISGLALAAAFVLYLRAKSANEGARSANLGAEQLERELVGTRKQLEKQAGSQRRRSEEMQELQRKLEKARKRAARARDGQQGESSRIKELERELELKAGELRNARQEISAGADAPKPAPRPAPQPAAPPPAARPAAAIAPVADAELQKRVERAEAERGKITQSLATARHDVERLRERVRTQDKLYLAIHGELEVKKDRIRHLSEELERLRAFKVAVFDPVPDGETNEDGSVDPAAVETDALTR